MSVAPHTSHQENHHLMMDRPSQCSSHCEPGTLNHKENPSFKWRADSAGGEGDKALYYTWNRTSHPAGRFLLQGPRTALGRRAMAVHYLLTVSQIMLLPK